MSNSFERGVRRAYEVYTNREKYCYLYGAKGQKLTRQLFDYLVKCSPKHFSAYTKDQLENYFLINQGKIALDCSGFVNYCFDWLPQRSSTNYYSHRVKEFDSYRESVGGALLYTTFGGKGRHIGIDVGSGYYIHSASEMTGIRLERFADNPNYWEHCFEAETTDYNGSTAECIYNM